MTLRIGILVAMFALGGMACGDDGGSSGSGGTSAGTGSGTSGGDVDAGGTTDGTADAGSSTADGNGGTAEEITACMATIPSDSANPGCAACSCEMCTALATQCNSDPLCLALSSCTNAGLEAGTCGSSGCYYDAETNTAGMGPCADEVHAAAANMEGADSMATLGGACALTDPSANPCANASIMGACLNTIVSGEPSICADCNGYPAAAM